MVIIYHGNVPSIKEGLAKAQDKLNARYVQLLGEERAQQVDAVATRVLTPYSFFDDRATVKRRLHDELPANASNKMVLVTPSSGQLDASGGIRERKVQTSIGFYISETGFHHSGSAHFTEDALASYVHEFDHFIWYALQRVPFYLAKFFCEDQFDAREAKGRGLEGYIQYLSLLNLPLAEKEKRLKFSLLSHTMTEVYEHSTRILDKLVLESIGIDVPLSWRGREIAYRYKPNPFVLDKPEIFQIPVGGDIFRNVDDQDVISLVLDWETSFRYLMRYIPIRNLMDSLRTLKVSKLSLQEMKALERKKKR